MATSMGHDRKVKQTTDDDDDDPIDKMLKETGCIDYHHKVQFCMADSQDWRKCQDEVNAFRKCMADYMKKKLDSATSDSNKNAGSKTNNSDSKT